MLSLVCCIVSQTPFLSCHTAEIKCALVQDRLLHCRGRTGGYVSGLWSVALPQSAPSVVHSGLWLSRWFKALACPPWRKPRIRSVAKLGRRDKVVSKTDRTYLRRQWPLPWQPCLIAGLSCPWSACAIRKRLPVRTVYPGWHFVISKCSWQTAVPEAG